MKRITPIFFLIFGFSVAYSQDTIIKTNNDTIVAKISEITPTEVKFKRFNFLDGPNYTELKSNIKMIIYANGLKESFESESVKEPVVIKNDYYSAEASPINNKIEVWGSRYRHKNSYLNEKEVQEVLLNTKDKKIIGLVGQAKDAKNLQFIGFAGIPLGITSVVFFWKSTGIFSYYGPSGKLNQEDLAISAVCGLAAVACPVISIVSKANRKKYNRQAIKIYNEKY